MLIWLLELRGKQVGEYTGGEKQNERMEPSGKKVERVSFERRRVITRAKQEFCIHWLKVNSWNDINQKR